MLHHYFINPMKVHAIVAKLFYHQIVVACCANMTQQILHAQNMRMLHIFSYKKQQQSQQHVTTHIKDSTL